MATIDPMSAVSDTVAMPVPIFKKRSSKGKASSTRKRPATPPPQATESDSDVSSSDGEGRRIKKRRKNGLITATSTLPRLVPTTLDHPVSSSISSSIISSNDAAKQSNWYDEEALNSKALLGSTRAIPPPATNPSDPTYQGSAAYTKTFITKNPNASSRSVGPIKAPTNIRTITVTDFAPDVCKDYKQTGFCGFGDSCKFLHAREDYKQGWQLDREWDISTKTGKKREAVGGRTVASANRQAETEERDEERDEEEEKLLEGIPFACIICKEGYRDPVVTKCGHYFCERCALSRYRKNPSCAACGAGTGGVFNGARGLKKLLEKKRERAARLREEESDAEDDIADAPLQQRLLTSSTNMEY